MKVLAVTPLYPPSSRVGAWLATHAQLAHLVERGHEVTTWAYLANQEHWSVDGVEVHGKGFGVTDAERLAADVDVVVGHCGDDGRTAEVAEKCRRPLVQFFHGGQKPPDTQAALVAFNSAASMDAVKWSGRSVLAHPYTDPSAHRAEPGEAVTLVNCSVEKGVVTFGNVARALNHRRFLAVMGSYGNQRPVHEDNVDQIPPSASMARDVWSRTRILLMPSRHEAWGMVGVEALASGIPVIASDLPGLRESLGDAGVFLPPKDCAAWADEVERLHDPHEWAIASKAAKARSAELAADDPRPRFAEALEALCSS